MLLLALWGMVCAQEAGLSNVGITCLDGKKRALGIYVPPQISATTPAPLFFWLHGGTTRMDEDRGAEAVTFFRNQALKAGIICAAPSAQRGATWFDAIGYDNILKSFAYMLSRYKIDPEKIFIGGSSDGATACYLLAMRGSLAQAKGFVVCSGFPGILNQLGVKFEPRLCAQYSWYIIHTGKDVLYPLPQVEQAVAEMKKAGARVVFKKYPNLPHGLEYADAEKPLILKWMLKNKRNGKP
jgi:acetyl esterase/lipase